MVVIVIVLVIMIVLVGPLAWDLPSLWLNPGELWELNANRPYAQARSIMLRSPKPRRSEASRKDDRMEAPADLRLFRRTRL